MAENLESNNQVNNEISDKTNTPNQKEIKETPPDTPIQPSSRIESPLLLLILFAALWKIETHENGVILLYVLK